MGCGSCQLTDECVLAFCEIRARRCPNQPVRVFFSQKGTEQRQAALIKPGGNVPNL